MYLTAICGGIVGIAIAWAMDYYFTMREHKQDEKYRKDIEAIQNVFKRRIDK